jgi:hypothetical protein
MKVRTSVKAGTIIWGVNHAQAAAARPVAVRTGVRAGLIIGYNHSQAVAS